MKTSHAFIAATALLASSVIAVLGWHKLQPQSAPEAHPTTSHAKAKDTSENRPTLYCTFSNFTHTKAVVSFYFSVDDILTSNPRFLEIYIEEGDETREVFNDAARPLWLYAIEDGTPVISSPDAATKILLYGIKPDQPGVFWTEAGLRSNNYRNLEGKCRQAYLTSQKPDPRRERAR